ncbi:MAG: head-tail connector protein [Thermodesulfobacteriota bacterium]|nr:head-tail connector protein [Thermodesulfobacteriota bacterium]
MALVLVSKSTNEPVSIDEVKAHLRILTTSEDNLLGVYIISARSYAENLIKSELTTATRKLILDDFPGEDKEIELPRPPLSTSSSDVSIEYINTTGATASVTTSVYVVDHESRPGRIYCGYDQEWPDTRNENGAVRITYKCGYSTGACPEPIKHWIKLRVGAMYENREALSNDGVINRMQYSFVDGLLDEFRVMGRSE